MLFFFCIPSASIAQQIKDSHEVRESNSLQFEKFAAELNAINKYKSKSIGDRVDSRSNIIESSIDGSSALISTTVTSKCNFIKRKPSTFQYDISDDGRLFIIVTVYGDCYPISEIADIEIKVINQQKEEYSKSGISYLLKVGNKIASEVRSDKKGFMSIFYEDGNNGEVDLITPYSATSTKYNEEIIPNRDMYFNMIGEDIKLNTSSPISKLYYVFSIDEFSFKLGDSDNTSFTREEFFNMISKWSKSDKFFLLEVPLVIN